MLRTQGRDACQMYLMSEIQKVYRSQGQNIHDKHFEVIIRKMLSKVQVTRPKDTRFPALRHHGPAGDEAHQRALAGRRQAARRASPKFCWA